MDMDGSPMTMRNIFIIIAVIVAVGGGCFIAGRCSVKPEIKIVEKEKIKWKDKIVYREYEKFTCSDLAAELLKYDTGEPRLDGIMKGDIFHAEAGLCDRSWSRDFRLKAAIDDSNNVRDKILCFFGGMVAGGILGGAVDNKIHAAFEK
jgi:hypothetical protein